MYKEGYCLGFDFGLKKIGYAIGQFITHTAQPQGIIHVKDGQVDWDAIRKIIKEWRPVCLIVGLPKAIDDSPLYITEYVLQFAKDLEQFHLPVHLSDERMTTKEAKSHLFEKGGFKALAYGKVDSVAAAILLEQWMNEPKASF
ncbi:MAG TPA: Holliday junction resolvase RuvX [Legionellales bacterium]|nr:Holliday junction resolvase RuvX [Legionellales bacterium]